MNVRPGPHPYSRLERPAVWQYYSQAYNAALPAYFIANRVESWARQDQQPHGERQRGQTIADASIAELQDRDLSVAGDLGWSLGYATAFCYRFIISNRFAIVSAIDDARRISLDLQTPFVLFSILDKHLFGGKLAGMVLLTWKAQGSSHPGTTCATRTVAKRICIQLNSTPFEEHTAGMSHLLGMLIHHMIHAYFLVCCGAQKKGEKQDGRMCDGLHFGVILATINDITLDCQEGSTSIIFHAAGRDTGPNRRLMRGRGSFISLDPVGMSLPPPAVDGRTHCMHDNRNITRAQIMNWQVQDYAKAIGENWADRGDKIFFWSDGEQERTSRMNAPPSKYYTELIWNKKRFAVPKERVLKYSAIKRLIDQAKHKDAEVPECSADVFDCVCKFITYGGYHASDTFGERNSTEAPSAGPPVLSSPHNRQGASLKLDVQVCKIADAMRFKELREYALKHLYQAEATNDDPIAMLRDIYDPSKSLSSELQNWARKFLARTDDDGSSYGQIGTSNYEKICNWHEARFTDIFSQYAMLREDCNLVVAGLRSGINPNGERQAFAKHIMDDPFTQRPFLSSLEQGIPFAMPIRRAFCL
ncbi:hypothetical protein AMS68_000200 [Peltaster fructicola]|uniref:Uncharacterized protein n=1 Tax=Peltaster fructicola TaxID=286661 RepID=A0A6H0XIY0_9PEZI|nr:hypothetical protein AMS68_000200 [Peltaster fructicola]